MSLYVQGIDDVRGMINHLRAIDKDAIKELNRTFKATAAPVVAEAKSRAAYSTRIPGAISLRANTANRKRPGVVIRVSAAKAPHGRLLEGMARGHKDRIRHPVFGNRTTWVNQPTRPYLRPAIKGAHPKFLAATGEAVRAAAKKNGFI